MTRQAACVSMAARWRSVLLKGASTAFDSKRRKGGRGAGALGNRGQRPQAAIRQGARDGVYGARRDDGGDGAKEAVAQRGRQGAVRLGRRAADDDDGRRAGEGGRPRGPPPRSDVRPPG